MNDIINSVALAIKSEYSTFDIYTESVEQGYMKPCFFIKQIDSGMTKVSLGRFQQDVNLDIHYFSESYSDMRDIGDRLFELMEYVDCDNGALLGKGMRHEIIDGVLHFFVSFKPIFVELIYEKTNMEEIDIEVK